MIDNQSYHGVGWDVGVANWLMVRVTQTVPSWVGQRSWLVMRGLLMVGCVGCVGCCGWSDWAQQT